MNNYIFSLIISILTTMAVVSGVYAQEIKEENTEIERSVEERLQAVRSKLKAYIGTVTSKTEETMQLESDQNEIKLVSINEEISYARMNGSVETIDFADVGIGDYVITMGTADENDVLIAKRIVITTQAKDVTKNAYQAKITNTDDGVMVRIAQENTDLELELNKGYSVTETEENGNTKTLRSTSLNQDDQVILIGFINDGVFETDRIHRIEQAPNDEDTNQL